jgi:hypothetical protein
VAVPSLEDVQAIAKPLATERGLDLMVTAGDDCVRLGFLRDRRITCWLEIDADALQQVEGDDPALRELVIDGVEHVLEERHGDRPS